MPQNVRWRAAPSRGLSEAWKEKRADMRASVEASMRVRVGAPRVMDHTVFVSDLRRWMNDGNLSAVAEKGVNSGHEACVFSTAPLMRAAESRDFREGKVAPCTPRPRLFIGKPGRNRGSEKNAGACRRSAVGGD